MRELSLNVFLKTMRESCQNERRYCFILGAGASRESGIKTGEEMARIWYREINEKYSQADRDAVMGELGIEEITPSSKTYFDLYALRFYPDYHNGSAYLERAMERAQPSFGYYPLATHLASTENNLVITTNFDSLVEDALFIYTDKRPLVISHELLADYININTKRPIVAKIHRGLFFDPLNRKEEVTGLSEKWKSVLRTAFQVFTPVFIGYAGGDHSLMDFLKDDSVKMNGLYWCYRHEQPSQEIQDLVASKGGYFVPIEGFDEMMYLMGQEFEYADPQAQIRQTAEERIERYNQQLQVFNAKLGAIHKPSQAQSLILERLGKASSEKKKLLDAAIQRDPDRASLYMERAQIFSMAKDYENAILDYDQAIRLKPTCANYYFHRGEAFSNLRQFERAISDYDQAIQLDPIDDQYYNQRGIAHDELHHFQAAINDYNHALTLSPEDAALYNNRGFAYYGCGEYDRALEDIRYSLELEPDESYTHDSLGCVYLALGQTEDAILEFTDALERAGDDAERVDPYVNRARAYLTLDRLPEALSDADAAVGLNLPHPNPLVFFVRGEIYRQQKNHKKAVADYTRAIELDPGCTDAYLARSDAYQALKQPKKAAADRSKAEELAAAEAPPATVSAGAAASAASLPNP